ncbi:MAG: hypothetical protein R3B48_21650 [Kofleriaceae bacterium]
MNGWPTAARLGAPTGWSHVTLSYNGSASLGNTSVRNTIVNTIDSYCGVGNQCVVICYSAGCARMLDAYRILKDQGKSPAILWSEAAASAAGGSELAVLSTKWWVKLLAKIFNLEEAAPIDYDIQPNTMRYGAYASVQTAASSPVYHLAGSQNICQTLKILFFIRIKLCGNSRFPGGHGDGVVPVHSAGGYADTGAHANTNDGSSKYVFRAYEQTPLYPADHRGILGPLVSTASLRLAVGKSATCPNMPPVDPSIPDASIVYEDGDGAFTEESSPLNMLILCGESVWNGAAPLYATCYSTQGCCSSFSTGSAGGCSCGEALCRQAKVARRSYYTQVDCTGTEYAESFGLNDHVSYDGLGMVGEAMTSVVVRSARTWPDGRCQLLVRRVTWNGGCPETYATTKSLPSARRVYRPAGAPPPPAGNGGELIVSTHNNNAYCP